MPSRNPSPTVIFWILRVGTAMEFLGHGALGLRHTAAWTSYFAVMGIGKETALALMPVIGACDVALAAAVLLYPVRALLLYMSIWGLWTALLRPLAGESIWEAVERAGNYGVPFALFLLTDGGGRRAWLGCVVDETLGERRRRAIGGVLRATTGMLLFGHGALGLLVHKPLLSAQYAAMGWPGASIEPLIGGFECLLAFAVWWRPGVALLLFVAGWKLATEALSPMTGSPIWVFIEHGGSYAAPLALAWLTRNADGSALSPFRRAPAG